MVRSLSCWASARRDNSSTATSSALLAGPRPLTRLRSSAVACSRPAMPSKPSLSSLLDFLSSSSDDNDGFDGIAGLLHATADDLKRVKGLGPAKRAELVAVLELSRRALAQQLKERTIFATPDAVKHYLQLHLAAKSHEVFAVLFLDVQNRLLALEELFRGTLTQTSVYPREVVLRALHHQASAVVLAHNHPSGTVQPSRADEMLTQ